MNLTSLNIAWTLITLTGFLASLRILYQCYGDFKYVKEQQIDSVRGAVSRMSLLNELARTITQGFFFLLGIIAIVVPQRWLTVSQVHAFNNVIVGLFITVAVILAVTSLVENIYRKIIIEKME